MLLLVGQAVVGFLDVAESVVGLTRTKHNNSVKSQPDATISSLA